MAYSSILHIVSPQKKKKKMSLADYLAECPHIYWVGIYMQKEIFFHESHDLSCLCQQEKTAETSRTITIPCSYSWNPSKGPYSIPICLNKYFCLYPCILIEIILGSYYSFTLPHDAKQQVENEINQASISLRNWQQVVL